MIKQPTNKLKIRILSETSIPYLIRHASFTQSSFKCACRNMEYDGTRSRRLLYIGENTQTYEHKRANFSLFILMKQRDNHHI